ncbi:MAG: hypothetical protein GX137_05860 [Thermoplasmatales archaeon]|jgi:hypothetical protein|nr:hypothetical protein [Thermoplasmatales archaeon]
MTDKMKRTNQNRNQETRAEIDPDTGEINTVFNDDVMVAEKQLWEKNPKRTMVMRDLWYNDLIRSIEEDDGITPEGRKEMAFMMATNSVLDMIMESVPEDLAMELSFCLDSTLGLAVVNKNNNVDLMEEYYKATGLLKREDYNSDDEFDRALEALEEHWWSIGQPALNMRSANDSIIEALAKYGLNE